MYIQFWLRGDSRTFRITDARELLRFDHDHESYKKDPTSITVDYYKCEVEGGERLQKKSVIFYDIERVRLIVERYPK